MFATIFYQLQVFLFLGIVVGFLEGDAREVVVAGRITPPSKEAQFLCNDVLGGG
jgi:hypothetical protein